MATSLMLASYGNWVTTTPPGIASRHLRSCKSCYKASAQETPALVRLDLIPSSHQLKCSLFRKMFPVEVALGASSYIYYQFLHLNVVFTMGWFN